MARPKKTPGDAPALPLETSPRTAPTGVAIGSKLWSMANTLRAAGVRPADYQAFILPLLMFKVVCDRNDGEKELVVAEHGEEFWELSGPLMLPFTIPENCGFFEQQGLAENLGEALRTALIEIEKSNAQLAGVFLDTDYASLSDDVIRALYSILSQVSFSPTQTSQDALGQAYEYLLGQFADAAGAKAGQFFTPIQVAKLLVALTAPQPGESVYDPTCGSGGLLNTAAEYLVEHGHMRSQVALFGQELDAQSFAIAKVNMFLHGNSGQIRRGDTLLDPKFTNDGSLQQFEVVVANPPFGLENTAAGVWPQDRFRRNRWGAVTKKPADLAFVSHMASSLKGIDDASGGPGRAAVVLPMGALFRKGVEVGMRRNLLESGIVDAVIALPVNLFYNTSIPASILVLRADHRRGEDVLFIDATQGFTKVKKQNTLEAAHLLLIEAAYQTVSDQGGIRTKLVPRADIIAADSDLTVSRWLPTMTVVNVDVPGALKTLRASEAASARASSKFWGRLAGAGYAEN